MDVDYNNKQKMYDIMNTTQSNYSNMLKRLQGRKVFSNFVIIYYSIALIIYSLTAEFFPQFFDTRLASYFNIILSVVMLTYSLIVSNAKYSERLQAAEKVLNEIKAKKRELTNDNIQAKRKEYDEIISKAEYRSELDFFKTIKQQCKENNVKWYKYKKGIENLAKNNIEEAQKLKNYLSENFPVTQQLKIILQYLWDALIFIIPILLFVSCFFIHIKK